MIEIEERGFIVGTAIDLVQKKTDNRYEVSIVDQLAISSAFGTSNSGSGDQEAFINLSASGDSLLSIDQDIDKQTSKAPYFQHLKVLIISEELAKTPNLFQNILDIHVRGAEFRRGIKVLVSNGKAKDIIDIKPKDEKLPSIYINKILEQNRIQSDVIKSIVIGDIQESNLRNRSYAIPIIDAVEDRVIFKGAAVFHGYEKRMIGRLTEKETFGLNMITGQDKTGSFDFNYKDEIISIEMKKIKNDMKVNLDDIQNIKVNVSLEIEGAIKEVFGHIYPTNQEDIEDIEKAAEKEIIKLVENVIKKTQEELKADVFGIDDLLYTRHYNTWEKIKDNWDHGENYFSRVTFNIKPEVTIDHTGTSQKTFGGRE